MRPVPVRLALVAALVVAGGCSGPLAPGGGAGSGAPPADGTPSVTAAPIPDSAAPTGAYAPGVEADGVTDPRTLASAHARALADRSYVVVSNRTERYGDGTLRSRLAVRVALAADRTYLAEVATAGPAAPVLLGEPPATASYWSNGTVYVRRLTRENRTTHTRFEPPGGGVGEWQYWVRTVPFGGGRGSPSSFYAAVFGAVPTRVVARDATRDPPVVRVVGSRPGGTLSVDGDPTDVRRVRLAANVTATGLVRSLSLRYVGDVQGRTVRVTWTIRYRRVGETRVERPPWYREAVD